MANRVNEDEKNERIIRGLLKLPENRRCINCNSLGPQYVCTNFWTFICTTCSGIHREYTHRVKSVSMAKFTSQEVNALQEGGNKRAKEIYLKEWDPQRNSFPDSSNVERLRSFIKHVYVDRRYSGERNHDKPPKGEKEDFYENRRTDSYQGGSRSPPYDENERRYSEKSSPGGRSYDGGRSPGYDQESRQYSDYRRSPARPEIVNDWHRERRMSGNGRRYEERRMSDGDLKLEGRSPERPKDPDSSSPPVVRPVREILGENTIPLRIIEPPKPAARIVDGSAHTQRTASSSSLGSANGNPVEVKLEPSGSLIDFDADPEPPVSVAVPTQQSTVAHSTPEPANPTNDNNWASFDAFPPAKVTQAPNANPLEAVLSQLSVSDPAPAPISGSSGNAATVTTAVNNLSTSAGAPPGLAPVMPVNGGNTLVNVSGATQWPAVLQQQQSPSLFPATGNQSSVQQFSQSATGPSSNQPWNLLSAPNAQGFPSNSMAQAPSAFLKPAHEVNSVVASQLPTSDVKSSGRKELPEDLFTFSYPAYRAPVPGWQTGPLGGMGYPMHYNTAMPIPTYQQPAKSSNPFDLGSDPPVQAPSFPSMAPLQGALPSVLNPSFMPASVMRPSGMPPSVIPPSGMPSSGLVHTSSLGAPSSAWMSPSSVYTSVLPPHAPPHASAMPPRPAYMGQQVPNNMPHFGHQGVGGGVAEGSAFGSLNADQQLGGRFSAPTTPTSFPSSGGNPFG